ncbi:hypothetical protein [Streptomyces lavendulocolor]|uniref:hypothetical protein n=1 Tax=Streptomyces lavendulocolor TaxID=67316 RepID=UPI003411BECA
MADGAHEEPAEDASEDGSAPEAPAADAEPAAPIPAQQTRGEADAEPPAAPVGKPTRAVRQPAKVIFGPVENGVDYLCSVTHHLAGAPTPRDLKYAILHLVAATEVLLKARLQLEHWSLIFEKPQTATRETFDNADFKSCGSIEALERLQNIAGLDIGNQQTKRDLNILIQWRNALQHYGLKTYKEGKAAKTVYAPAVEKVAANLLDFLLNFVRDELRPELKREELQALDDELRNVYTGLADIKKYLDNRMSRLRAELEPLRDQTVQCPLCKVYALLCNGLVECRFCEAVSEWGVVVAQEYVLHVQEIDWYSHSKDGGNELVDWCPECNTDSLVADVVFATGRRTSYFCFTCGCDFDSLASCDVCGRPAQEADGMAACGWCLDAKLERF